MDSLYRPGKEPVKRKDYSSIPHVIGIPNLLDLQVRFYERFLQQDVPPASRARVGLEEVFQSIFPITDFNNKATLEYLGYELGVWESPSGEYSDLGGVGEVDSVTGEPVSRKPIFDKEDCLKRGLTYSDPLKIKARLILRSKDESTGAERIEEIKEQKIYVGEIPLMTETGAFIINGVERVMVSQLHRSPGVFFTAEQGKGAQAGNVNYSARMIPYRGSWLDFEFDTKDILSARIDRKRKFPATILLKALGFESEELLSEFYESFEVQYSSSTDKFSLVLSDSLKKVGMRVSATVKDSAGNALLKAGSKLTRRHFNKLKAAKIKSVEVAAEDLIGLYPASDTVDLETGEIYVEMNAPLTEDNIALIRSRSIESLKFLAIDEQRRDTSFRATLAIDKVDSREEALKEIYKRARPGDPPTLETAEALFENLFFNPKRYDLSEVGRMKLNEKLGGDYPLSHRTLTKEDVIGALKMLFDLRAGIGSADDIDHLGNRRVRSVGESVENQFRIGLSRMEKTIVERMNSLDLSEAMPHDLINSKPVTAAIKEFFGSSQLSQFMDQTNPLSSVTHKRRLSALGPGGLTRERAGFEVRDVHSSHYGRICPIETPEGPNIGLISSLSTFGRVNDFGFIETPYRKVVDGVVTDEVVYMTATEEDKYTIAQANALLDESNRFRLNMISSRKGGDYLLAPPSEIEYVDVSPKQLVSVAASLIPFLENDDANRALMGSNMQRQAVPLLKTEAPLVGTGMESVVARDSGALAIARRAGTVISVDAARVVIRADETNGASSAGSDSGVDIYNLTKYSRSNQNTCVNQTPVALPGLHVASGAVIADGQSTDRGDLALGRNVLVAFMPWYGYNFEDAIIVSERLVKDDIFTSVHIEEFTVDARDTRLGKEEITRDIPNVSEEALRNLDGAGIIRVGSKVRVGDILVGKVTPKGETLLSPEEKLLKAIFGEKAGDVLNTSLVVPPGNEGTVISARVFTRRGAEKDERALAIEEAERLGLEKDMEDEITIITRDHAKRLRRLLVGARLSGSSGFVSEDESISFPRATTLTEDMLSGLPAPDLARLNIGDKNRIDDRARLIAELERSISEVKLRYNDRIEKFARGDELAPGVIKTVKVYVAIKRKLQVGDKMAGRHGNKGVVSIIVPEEDMPFTEDGQPIDMILNPLGVPSRMNVGQIMETNLGMAAHRLGRHVMTPVFDGAREADIKELMREAGYPEDGKISLIDGKTGERFDQEVTVGYIYMLKLHHLVDDKIHARSTGPYSLVTQQPLGGKAQFGGQRLGEMEVWALEGYGAAYTLQEMLTVKSDDVEGRKRMYESIVKGNHTFTPGMPESFNVLIKELQALALDVELIQD